MFSQSPSAGVTVEWSAFGHRHALYPLASVRRIIQKAASIFSHAPDHGTVSTKSQSIPSYWCADERSTRSTHPQRQGSIQGTRRGHSSFWARSWHSSSSIARLRCFVACFTGGPVALLLGNAPLGPFQTSRGAGGARSGFRPSSSGSSAADPIDTQAPRLGDHRAGGGGALITLAKSVGASAAFFSLSELSCRGPDPSPIRLAGGRSPSLTPPIPLATTVRPAAKRAASRSLSGGGVEGGLGTFLASAPCSSSPHSSALMCRRRLAMVT